MMKGVEYRCKGTHLGQDWTPWEECPHMDCDWVLTALSYSVQVHRVAWKRKSDGAIFEYPTSEVGRNAGRRPRVMRVLTRPKERNGQESGTTGNRD